jgi:hypothetical protein
MSREKSSRDRLKIGITPIHRFYHKSIMTYLHILEYDVSFMGCNTKRESIETLVGAGCSLSVEFSENTVNLLKALNHVRYVKN